MTPETTAHPANPQLQTEEQAAAILTVSPETMADWRHRNRLNRPAHIRVGGAIRYRQADLLAWLESNTNRPLAGPLEI